MCDDTFISKLKKSTKINRKKNFVLKFTTDKVLQIERMNTFEFTVYGGNIIGQKTGPTI